MFRSAAAIVIAALAALPARAQPLPPEFQVNTGILGNQERPSIDSNAAGDYIVGWTTDGAISVRLYGSIQGEFTLPASPDGPDWLTDIALGQDGFGVTFDRTYLGGVSTGAVARFYSHIGLPLSPEVPLGPDGASLAATDSGFVVVYPIAVGQPFPPLSDLVARHYRPDGSPMGTQIPVGAERLDEGIPSVAALPDGRFVVAWAGDDLGDNVGVFVRAFDAAGSPVSAAVPVAAPVTYTRAIVDVDDTGAFAVAWRDGYANNASATTMARRYDASATALGPAVRVDDEMNAYYGHQALSLGGDGTMTVSWVRSDLENSYHNPNVVARRYAPDGAPLGPTFRVNVRMQDIQWSPVVTTLPTGELIIVWESHGQDGSGAGIFGRAFGGATPARSVTFGGLKALFERE